MGGVCINFGDMAGEYSELVTLELTWHALMSLAHRIQVGLRHLRVEFRQVAVLQSSWLGSLCLADTGMDRISQGEV